MIRRRDLIVMLGGLAAAWPRQGLCQTSSLRRVAILNPQPERASLPEIFSAPFAEELRKLGWIEGHNLEIEYRYAANDRDLFVRHAREIVASAPDVIVGISPPAVLVLREQTRTIPIVFVSVGDPVGYGFIESMARPGGNITGMANFGFAMGGKWIETLKEIAPHLTRAAFIYHPATATKGYEAYLRSVMAAAPSFGVTVSDSPISDEVDIESVITAFAREQNGGLIVPPDPFTIEHRKPIFALATRYRLPAIYAFSYLTRTGGLVSYGVDNVEQVQKTATYVSRILNGQRPTDLPAETPTRFELVVNLKTAKALGITIPPTLIARADEVIE